MQKSFDSSAGVAVGGQAHEGDTETETTRNGPWLRNSRPLRVRASWLLTAARQRVHSVYGQRSCVRKKTEWHNSLRHGQLAKRHPRVLQPTVRRSCTCRRLRSSSRLAFPCLRRQLDLRRGVEKLGLVAALELLSAATCPEGAISADATASTAGRGLHTPRWSAHSSSVAGRREVAQHGPGVRVR